VTPEQTQERSALHARSAALIARLAEGARDDAARDALLVSLASYQRRWVPAYGRFVASRLGERAVESLSDVPALPTDAFRFARIASFDPAREVRRFRSSGTTSDTRSEHPYADLTLYDAAARAAARYALFPDRARMQLVILAPPEQELSDSSLSYMLARFVEWFGSADSRYVWPVDEHGMAALDHALSEAVRRDEPVALLGTSFAFVHALDQLGGKTYRLPRASRLMQTGGFKGRSREVAPAALRALMGEAFGIPEPFIVAEYGMTELSSQLYETTLREAALGLAPTPRALWAPGWVRALPVHPETLLPVREGEEGLVRIDDAANLDSVACIQTADIGRLEGGRLVLRGRAQGAVARGCSITADELLGGAR
jgi:hypothetical protein